MKKFLSALMAITMLATTFVSSAFAAGVNVGLKSNASKDGVEAGAEVVISMELTGDQGFANFVLGIGFDKDVFELTKAAKTKKTDWDGSLVMPDLKNANDNGLAKTTFANVTDNGFDDEEWYQVDYTFKVKSGAAAGTYDFVSSATGAMKNQNGVEIKPVCGKTSVLVKAAVPAEITVTTDSEAATKYEYGEVYNQGVGGTVTVPEGKSTTGLTITLNNGEKDGTVDFDFGTNIAANTTFGLNICRIPKDTTITFVKAEAK